MELILQAGGPLLGHEEFRFLKAFIDDAFDAVGLRALDCLLVDEVRIGLCMVHFEVVPHLVSTLDEYGLSQ